ncbi:MAG: EVE domain-containing protein [Alphaproteobacteria bacterium]|nr:EVE domain-containing protein [Alphaproteobacteria bacterium]
MNYWLMKTEPETWSWDDQVKKGVEPWNGVRNFRARSNMKAMKKGDRVFFYHSGDERQIVGIVTIVREAYPDPTDESGRFVCVDVKTDVPLKRPVTLKEAKEAAEFSDMELVRLSRLSVQKVAPAAWRQLCKMGGVKP